MSGVYETEQLDGTFGSVLEPNLMVASVLIITATALGLIGAERSLRGSLNA